MKKKNRKATIYGENGYVAYLVNREKDTFHIEYGSRGIINNLYEISPSVFSLDRKSELIKQLGKEPDPEEVLFSEYPEEDDGKFFFDKDYFMYDTINHIIVKIIQPKK
ncbi:MAG: hypothetical protein H7122_16690 [Chitinophagaceae bacterium]|nr:hypothetical protein [Chitinophagaceae bacterium]